MTEAGARLRVQLMRGGAVTVIGRATGLLAGFAVTVLLARMLGPAGYGVYALAQSLVTLLTVPAEFGLPTLVIRETAVAATQRDWAALHGMLRWSQRFVLVASAALGLAALLVTYGWRTSLAPGFPLTMAVAIVFLIVSSISGLLQGVLQGVKQSALALLPDMLLLPCAFAAALAVLALILKMPLTPALAMGLYTGCAALSLAVVVAGVRVRLPPETWQATPLIRHREWIRAALPLCLTAGLTLVNSQVLVLLVGTLGSARDAGLYRVAASGAGMAIIVGATLGGVVSPHIAYLHERGDRARIAKLASWSAWVGALPAVLLLALYAVAGGRLLTLAFGARFAPALPALLVLTVGQTVNAATGVRHVLLNMTGHGRDTLQGVALGAVTSLTLCAALIPAFGLNGAAIASTLGIIAENLYLVVRVKLRLNIDSTILPRSPA